MRGRNARAKDQEITRVGVGKSGMGGFGRKAPIVKIGTDGAAGKAGFTGL
jgi:hypothetical protein